MKPKEDIRKIRVLVAYGDHIQEDTIIELKSVRWGIENDEEKASEAMILLVEAAGLVAKKYHVHHGYHLPR